MKSFCRALFAALLFACASLSALDRQSTSDYRARRVALADKLNGGIAILFAAEEPSIEYLEYRQDEDFYYLTGWNEPGAALLVQAPVAAQGSHPRAHIAKFCFYPHAISAWSSTRESNSMQPPLTPRRLPVWMK